MTHTYAAYKRPTSEWKTYTDWKWRAGNKFSKQIDRGKKSQGNNIHIRQNRLQKTGHKKRPRRSLHNTQGKNLSRRHEHCKYICTQHRSTQIHKENLGRLQERYWRQQHNYSKGSQDPTVKNGYVFHSTNKDIVALNNTLDQIDLTDIYRAVHPKEAKYTLFKCIRNIFKGRSHNRTQNKPQQILENWNHIKHLLWPQGTETRNKYQGKNPKTLENMEIWIACY